MDVLTWFQDNAVVSIAAVSLLLFLTLMGIARSTSGGASATTKGSAGSTKAAKSPKKSPKKGSVST